MPTLTPTTDEPPTVTVAETVPALDDPLEPELTELPEPELPEPELPEPATLVGAAVGVVGSFASEGSLVGGDAGSGREALLSVVAAVVAFEVCAGVGAVGVAWSAGEPVLVSVAAGELVFAVVADGAVLPVDAEPGDVAGEMEAWPARPLAGAVLGVCRRSRSGAWKVSTGLDRTERPRVEPASPPLRPGARLSEASSTRTPGRACVIAAVRSIAATARR